MSSQQTKPNRKNSSPSSFACDMETNFPAFNPLSEKKIPDAAINDGKIEIVDIKEFTSKDILCGRDSFSFNYCGNKRFRVTIDIYRERYQNTTAKKGKTNIITEIMELVEESGGRFLKCVEENSDSWFVINDNCAREKVGHALRSSKYRKKREKRIETTVSITKEDNEHFETILKRQKTILNDSKKTSK